jgi:hypothetical protein
MAETKVEAFILFNEHESRVEAIVEVLCTRCYLYLREPDSTYIETLTRAIRQSVPFRSHPLQSRI